MNFRQAIRCLLVLPICAIQAGCQDDFGDRAARFVNEEVHGISRAYAEETLKSLVLSAFTGSVLDIAVQAKLAVHLARDFETRKIDSATIGNAELLAEFTSLDIHAATLWRIKSQLESNLIVISRVEDTCRQRSIFVLLGLGGLGLQGPIVLATAGLREQQADWSVSASGGNMEPWYVSTVKAIGSLLGANQVREQNEKLKEALALVPTKVVQDGEVYEMYRRICSGFLDELRPAFEQAKSAVQEANISIQATLDHVLAEKAIAEAVLRTREISAFLASSGVREQLSAANDLILRGQLGSEVLIRLNELQRRVETVRVQDQCVNALTAIEEFEDAVRELNVELATLRAHVASVPALEERVDAAITRTVGMLASVPGHYDWAKAGPCAQ